MSRRETSMIPADRVSRVTRRADYRLTVLYEASVSDPAEAERRVHALLEARGCRVTKNREFFNASPTDAINAVITVVAAFAGLDFRDTRGGEPDNDGDHAVAVESPEAVLAGGRGRIRGIPSTSRAETAANRSYRQQSGRLTVDRDRSGQNRDREVSGTLLPFFNIQPISFNRFNDVPGSEIELDLAPLELYQRSLPTSKIST